MLPKTLHLMKDETLLAKLTICEPIEMFCLACNFESIKAFEEFAPLFEEASNSSISDTEEGFSRFDEIYQQIYNMGIRLIDVEHNRNCSYFVLHIEDGKVQTRFVLEDNE
jgi:hypothetical protein